jgi:uncharacterized protein (TIGR02453 family)
MIEGIPAEAFDFYDALRADNSRAFWAQHKGDYDTYVRGPLQRLADALADEFGPAQLFRPYRDVRFSKDKAPYKDHQGAFAPVGDAVGYYLQVSSAGLMIAGGWYSPQGQQLARYREAVDGPAGAELERIVQAVARKGLEIGGDVMKTRPRGVDPGHPRLALLRHRSVTATRMTEPQAWMESAEAVRRVRKDWRSMRPLVEWLAAHVGPGEDDRPGR